MKSIHELIETLREVAGPALLQEEPYVVVAPKTTEQGTACIQAARDHSCHVMILGSGSSFPPDFALLRDNVIALLTVRLTGIQSVSPFVNRVLCGTPVEAILNSEESPPRRTLGGLIADARSGLRDPALRAIWAQTVSLEIFGADHGLQTLPAAASATNRDGASAELLIGSRGRLGWIAALHLKATLPIHVESFSQSGSYSTSFNSTETALRGGDLRALFDAHSLFQW